MFKRGEKVVYPKHGAGKIIQVSKQIVIGQEKKYYKIKFFDSPVLISVPIDSAQELGLRHPMSKKTLTEALKNLYTKVAIEKKTLITLDAVTKKNLSSGKIEDVIELVNILKSLAKQKEEENKNFSYSYSDRLEIAMDFIKSEVLLVLGERALKKYNLI
jgi:CarD family transcriptional regulator